MATPSHTPMIVGVGKGFRGGEMERVMVCGRKKAEGLVGGG
jgi:hypothetical protein